MTTRRGRLLSRLGRSADPRSPLCTVSGLAVLPPHKFGPASHAAAASRSALPEIPQWSLSACHTAELHLKPDPKAICQMRSPRLRRRTLPSGGGAPPSRSRPHALPYSAISSSSYQIEADETLPYLGDRGRSHGGPRRSEGSVGGSSGQIGGAHGRARERDGGAYR